MAEKKNVFIMSGDAFERESEKGVFGAFLFFGEDDYLKERALSKLRERILSAEGFELFNHFDISFSGASNLSRDELFASLSDAVDALPMMQEQKLIEIHDLNVDKLNAAEMGYLTDACKKAGEDTVMIIFCRENELDCGYRFEVQANFVKLSGAAKPVRFQTLPKARLASYAKKYLLKEDIKMSDGAASTLCDMCACKMMALTGELSKLSAYYSTVTDGEKIVNEADVRRICSETTGEETPFALVDAMQKWKLVGVLEVLRTMRDQREEPVVVVSKMAKVYMEMLFIKSLMITGMNAQDISKKMKMNAFRVEKFVLSLEKAPITVIENAIKEIYELDLALKSTQSDPWLLIELFVAKVYLPKSMR